MRNKFKFVAMFLALSTIFSALAFNSVYADVSHYENLIDKADIEDADDSFCNPKCGTFLGIDSEKAHSGSKSVKTKVTSTWAHLVQIKTLDNLMPGKKYIVSFWYYTDAAFNGGAQMTYVMNCNNSEGTAGAVEDYKSRQAIVVGEWTKFQFVFEAQENTARLNYIYPAVVGGSGYGNESFMWFDDFNLRMIPDAKTNCKSSEVVSSRPDSTEVKYVFDAEPDIHSAYEAVRLNGELLDRNDISISVNKNDAEYEMCVNILKELSPLAEYDIELQSLTDVYGMNVETSNLLKISLVTLPTVGVDAYYCKTDDQTSGPLTSLTADEISLVYNLKNNTAVTRECYVVTALCTGNSISKILNVNYESIPSSSETGEKTVDIGKVSENCYVRTFYWSSLEADTVRALNEITEIR